MGAAAKAQRNSIYILFLLNIILLFLSIIIILLLLLLLVCVYMCVCMNVYECDVYGMHLEIRGHVSGNDFLCLLWVP